jgi:excisionase family DNA binding protein
VPTKFLTTSDVARRLDLAPDTVRALNRSGKLRAIRTESGRRIFREADVLRFIAKRERGATLRQGDESVPAA